MRGVVDLFLTDRNADVAGEGPRPENLARRRVEAAAAPVPQGL